jgi:hypothetical protein
LIAGTYFLVIFRECKGNSGKFRVMFSSLYSFKDWISMLSKIEDTYFRQHGKRKMTLELIFAQGCQCCNITVLAAMEVYFF